MNRGPVLASALVLVTFSWATQTRAQGRDRAAAMQHFRDALALKDADDCARALPLFQESARLDKQAKTLIQLADCEERLGKWTDALRDWRDARDQASLGSDPVSERQHEVAEQRMHALDAKLPRLTIALAQKSPANTRVARDGVQLGVVSLNRPLPLDPGEHLVVAEAPGHAAREWRLVLAPGEHETLEVILAAKQVEAPRQRVAPIAPTRKQVPNRTEPPRPGNWQRIAGLALGAAGGVSGTVAGALWLSAWAKHDQAVDRCDPDCGPDARARQDEAVERVDLARILGIAGAVAVGAGFVMFATAPTASGSAVYVGLSPAMAVDETRLHLSGRW
jgi:hypothetical protein